MVLITSITFGLPASPFLETLCGVTSPFPVSIPTRSIRWASLFVCLVVSFFTNACEEKKPQGSSDGSTSDGNPPIIWKGMGSGYESPRK
jgi:hypothetical protein